MIALGLRVLFLAGGLLSNVARAQDNDVKYGNLFSAIPKGHAGSCEADGWDIEKTMDEANELFKTSIAWIDALTTTGPFPNNPESLKKLNIASAVFAVRHTQLESGELEIRSGMENLKEARENYVRSQSYMNDKVDVKTKELDKKSSRWRLECGEEDLKWITTLGDLSYKSKVSRKPKTDPLPKALQEDMAFQIKDMDISHYKGVYWSQYWSYLDTNRIGGARYTLNRQYFVGPDALTHTQGPSETTTIAETYYMGLFNSALASQLLLLYQPFRDWKRSLSQAAQEVDSGKIKRINSVFTKAGTLLHELTHMSTHKFESKRIIDQEWEGERASDLEDCIKLGWENEGADAKLLPLHAYSYQFFAEASYYDSVDWWPEGTTVSSSLEFEDDKRVKLIESIVRQDPELANLPRANFFALWFSDLGKLQAIEKSRENIFCARLLFNRGFPEEPASRKKRSQYLLKPQRRRRRRIGLRVGLEEDFDRATGKIIRSGHIFTITTNDPKHKPLPSFQPLKMHWILAQIAAMQGAGKDEDSDMDSDGDSIAVLSP
ncbi:hypothetical protein N7492_001398 [Penicillium capsulatum]|uniref:Lysine-specific metallo-endopeptidase domain-containing protein n=1 Tax=Penicillium capsulatum TaxID=69766 RepID=A0A9W9ITL5_9EURO|nr:hypothetical protein N7492_001398 [Penicillium capsulatum]KAJ6129547.1 hypothetical protein N7512_002327 [Penicillium capsulatum]